MSFEIERKFLITGDGWRPLVTKQVRIRQAYLSENGGASIRVRIKDNGGAAALTIKSRSSGLRRLELEYPIPVADAEALLALRRGSIVEKQRAIVPWDGLVWEVDTFAGDNEGLVIAEVELETEHQHVNLPPWVGAEVTHDEAYYNSHLSLHPFAAWGRVRSTT